MLCSKFGLNWLSGSGEEDFFNFVDVFWLFRNYSPWKRAVPFIWRKLNPFPPRMLWAKFGWNWFWRKGFFFISAMYFRYFVFISLWKRAGPFLWTNLNPFTQGCFVPSLVEIGSVFLEEKIEMWKICGQTDRRTTGDQKISLIDPSPSISNPLPEHKSSSPWT